jgi:hypothetical protein
MRLLLASSHALIVAAALGVASSALGQAQPNLLQNSSFESGATSWLVSGPAQVQQATWAAGAGQRGVWLRGFDAGSAAVSQAVTAPTAGDYVLLYKSKVEQNYFAVPNSLNVDLSGPSSSVSRSYSSADAGGYRTTALKLTGVQAGQQLSVGAYASHAGGTGQQQSAFVDSFYLGKSTNLRSTPLFDGERRDFDNQSALLNNFGGGFGAGNTGGITSQSSVVRSGTAAYKVDLGSMTAGQSKFFQTYATELKGASDRNTRDLGYFDSFETYVRNDTGSPLTVTLELKDYRDSLAHSATKNFVVPAGASWSPISTSLNLANGWTVNGSPQLDQMYAMTFAVKPQQGFSSGSIYFDDARLVEPGAAIDPLTAPIHDVAEALAQRTFHGLWGQRSRQSGIVPNTSTDADTGALNTTAGLVWTLPSAVRRGWVTQTEADNYMSQLSDTLVHTMSGTTYLPSRFVGLSTGNASTEESSIDAAFIALGMQLYKAQPGVDPAVKAKVNSTVNQFNFAAFEASDGWRLAYTAADGFTSFRYKGYTGEGKTISLAAELADTNHVDLEDQWHSDTLRTRDSLADNDNNVVTYTSTDHRAPFGQALVNLFVDVSDRGLDTYPNASVRTNSWQNFKDFEVDSGEYLAQEDRPYFYQPDAARGGPPSGYKAYSLYNLQPSGGVTNEDLFMPWSSTLALLSGDENAEFALRFLLQSDMHGPLGMADGARWTTGAEGPSMVNALQDNWNLALSLMALMRYIDGPDSAARYLADLPRMSEALDNLFFEQLPGDYNRDGAISQADYEVWSSTYGSGDLSADGNGDGVVDAADYTVWRDQFAMALANATSTPEPTGAALVLLAILAAASRNRTK